MPASTWGLRTENRELRTGNRELRTGNLRLVRHWVLHCALLCCWSRSDVAPCGSSGWRNRTRISTDATDGRGCLSLKSCLSPLRKGHVTAAAQRLQRKMLARHAYACCAMRASRFVFTVLCAPGVSAVRFCSEVMPGIARAGGLRPG